MANMGRWVAAAACLGLAAGPTVAGGPAAPRVALERVSGARWRFGGELGTRVDRNVSQWLLRMPEANPGLLDMFRRRERRLPAADLVPWAGEFAGKYLISAVQACRMSEDPRLHGHVARFVADLIACQDADGYLGPFPKARRLMGDCDLWGHYHVMQGLWLWHDLTGDGASWRAAVRAGDLIVRTYGPGGRRPIEAGSACFNMGVYHAMAELLRRTGDAKYRAVIRRIEEDMPKDGDWLRQGAAGVPHFRLPASGPRWEPLHLLQGFVTMFEVTGEERYRKAALGLWDSIRRYDRHPSGAFSTNEQASGTIFGAGSIETCCSVAWMALSIDALRITGDPKAADEIELTLWNQALAAQHPSGQWCTYDTPLNGIRAPSYQQIAFQYRPGAPELNCCSVNSPRTLGMTADWAVMRGPDGRGLTVNFYGPCSLDLPLTAGTRIRLTQTTRYPVAGEVRLAVSPTRASRFPLRLRIPAWSAATSVRVNGAVWGAAARPGSYLTLERTWRTGDVVEISLDMRPRVMAGQGPSRGGQAAISAGPLLLAFDAGQNRMDLPALKPIDVRRVALRPVAPAAADPAGGRFEPMGLWELSTPSGPVRLCDFASAGARGTEYAAWLPAGHLPPAPSELLLPRGDEAGKPGPILFRWAPTAGPDDSYTLVIARDAACATPVVERSGLHESAMTIEAGLDALGDYYWQVRTVNGEGSAVNAGGSRRFTVDVGAGSAFRSVRADGLMAGSAMRGAVAPAFGAVELAQGVSAAAGRDGAPDGSVRFDGEAGGIRIGLPFFPERDYSFEGWFCPEAPAKAGLQQIFSGWCRGADDPLRVVIDGGRVFARIEGGSGAATGGAPLESGVWTHVAAVKQGALLTLYVNGAPLPSSAAPELVRSGSLAVGIGFNPLYPQGERFQGRIGAFSFVARALTPAEALKAAGR